ncbi:MAG TPA: PepSY domain-containing protein [Xanthobacteraceae bacterium]
MTFSKTLAAIVACGAVATGAAATTLSSARAFTGEELAPAAKITLAEARAIALKAFPGEIAAEELEKERGGSGLRYSFDIKNGAVVHEIGVDAKTGRILENSVERAGNH